MKLWAVHQPSMFLLYKMKRKLRRGKTTRMEMYLVVSFIYCGSIFFFTLLTFLSKIYLFIVSQHSISRIYFWIATGITDEKSNLPENLCCFLDPASHYNVCKNVFKLYELLIPITATFFSFEIFLVNWVGAFTASSVPIKSFIFLKSRIIIQK